MKARKELKGTSTIGEYFRTQLS